MDNRRIIRITKNKIYLTNEMYLNLSNTSLKGDDISFRTFQDIYFEIEIIGYNKENEAIEVEVVDYEPKNFEKFNTQMAKSSVSYILFKPLIWSKLVNHLASYTYSKLLREGIVIGSETLLHDINTKVKSSAILHFSNGKFLKNEPEIETVTETSKIYFKDASFHLGHVSFNFFSKKLKENFNLKIENLHILPEFNLIKSYFPKALNNKKQFSIKVAFTKTNKEVTNIETTSAEISKIDENILDAVKRERVAKLFSAPLQNMPNKALFTSNDVFDDFEDNVKDGNVFKQTEEDILNLLLEVKEIRNAKQLQFLSGAKHSSKQKIRFTLKPNFGFVFFIEGETKNHFCWELVNSHATYLWSFNKTEYDIAFQFKRIEEIINNIRDLGRERYKIDYKNKTIDNDLAFCTIEHKNINSSFVDGFVEWKHRFKEKLV